jgi:hypothetical protein
VYSCYWNSCYRGTAYGLFRCPVGIALARLWELASKAPEVGSLGLLKILFRTFNRGNGVDFVETELSLLSLYPQKRKGNCCCVRR